MGIPWREDHVGSKIILTSRNLDVCRAMSTNVEVRVDFLNGVEAWQLFCQSAGEVAFLVLQTTTNHLQKQFPENVMDYLGYHHTGTAMRGKKMDNLWKHALNEFRRSAPGIKGSGVMIHWKVRTRNLVSCIALCFLRIFQLK